MRPGTNVHSPCTPSHPPTHSLTRARTHTHTRARAYTHTHTHTTPVSPHTTSYLLYSFTVVTGVFVRSDMNPGTPFCKCLGFISIDVDCQQRREFDVDAYMHSLTHSDNRWQTQARTHTQAWVFCRASQKEGVVSEYSRRCSCCCCCFFFYHFILRDSHVNIPTLCHSHTVHMCVRPGRLRLV